MRRPPRKTSDSLITPWLLFRYTVIGIYVGLATVGGFATWYLTNGIPWLGKSLHLPGPPLCQPLRIPGPLTMCWFPRAGAPCPARIMSRNTKPIPINDFHDSEAAAGVPLAGCVLGPQASRARSKTPSLLCAGINLAGDGHQPVTWRQLTRWAECPRGGSDWTG